MARNKHNSEAESEAIKPLGEVGAPPSEVAPAVEPSVAADRKEEDYHRQLRAAQGSGYIKCARCGKELFGMEV